MKGTQDGCGGRTWPAAEGFRRRWKTRIATKKRGAPACGELLFFVALDSSWEVRFWCCRGQAERAGNRDVEGAKPPGGMKRSATCSSPARRDCPGSAIRRALKWPDVAALDRASASSLLAQTRLPAARPRLPPSHLAQDRDRKKTPADGRRFVHRTSPDLPVSYHDGAKPRKSGSAATSLSRTRVAISRRRRYVVTVTARILHNIHYATITNGLLYHDRQRKSRANHIPLLVGTKVLTRQYQMP